MELIADPERFLNYARDTGHVDVYRKLTYLEEIRKGTYKKVTAMLHDYIVEKPKGKKYVMVEISREAKDGFIKPPLLIQLMKEKDIKVLFLNNYISF